MPVDVIIRCWRLNRTWSLTQLVHFQGWQGDGTVQAKETAESSAMTGHSLTFFRQNMWIEVRCESLENIW